MNKIRCPKCTSSRVALVENDYDDVPILGSLLANSMQCRSCQTQFCGKTGRSNVLRRWFVAGAATALICGGALLLAIAYVVARFWARAY